jgi:alpha-amylase
MKDHMCRTGSVTALGNWKPSNAITLNASQYTQSTPLWSGTVRLPPGTVIQYKFVKASAFGTVTWEADPNRVYTVPCAAAMVNNTWR